MVELVSNHNKVVSKHSNSAVELFFSNTHELFRKINRTTLFVQNQHGFFVGPTHFFVGPTEKVFCVEQRNEHCDILKLL